MREQEYIVKEGDTLWDISETHLKDPFLWPSLWEFNNKRYQQALQNNRWNSPSQKIENPHLIFVGQKLLIPKTSELKNKPPKPKALSKEEGSKPAVKDIQSIPFKYSLSKSLIKIPIAGGFTAAVSVSAEVTIQSKKTIEFAEFENNNLLIKAEIQTECNEVFHGLTSDFKVAFDPKSKQITFESAVSTNAQSPVKITYASSTSYDVHTKEFVYKVSIQYPKIEGDFRGHIYSASMFSVEIEIRKSNQDNSNTSRKEAFEPQIVHENSKDKATEHSKIFSGGAIPKPQPIRYYPQEHDLDSTYDYSATTIILGVAATIVVAVALVDDFIPPAWAFTGGPANNAPVFALAQPVLAALGLFGFSNAATANEPEISVILPEAKPHSIARLTYTFKYFD